jgi:acetyl esterase/lipase
MKRADPKTTESEISYERLHEAILSGELLPHERLIETELAERVGVGRAAIRTALARLEQDGLVEHEPHRGAKVRAISEQEAIEILEVRSVLEGLIARYAAINATPQDLHELQHDTPDSPESQLVGGSIQQHPDRVAQANPITHINGDLPPFLIIHGDSDPLVPHQQSAILHQALQAAGGQSAFYTVAGGGHGHFSDPMVAALTNSFLQQTVGNPKIS